MNTNAQKPSTVIVNGQFATGKDRKGNFTGKNAEGLRIYVPKQMMKDTFGVENQEQWIKLNEKSKVMFDVIYDRAVEYNVVDDKNEPVKDENGVVKTFTIENCALSIFKDRADFIRARNSDRMQTLQVEKDYDAEVKTSDLSQATIDRLLSVSPLG